MIFTTGIVSFLSNDLKPTVKIVKKSRTIRLEIIERSEVFSKSKQKNITKITCKYAALLIEDWECKSINDYIGKVKPFLENHIKGTITSVEVEQLQYRRNITSL